MAEVEKILCCDRGCCNNNNDPLAMAAMMNGGMNNWQNNPFIYLVWMMFAQRMWAVIGAMEPLTDRTHRT